MKRKNAECHEIRWSNRTLEFHYWRIRICIGLGGNTSILLYAKRRSKSNSTTRRCTYWFISNLHIYHYQYQLFRISYFLLGNFLLSSLFGQKRSLLQKLLWETDINLVFRHWITETSTQPIQNYNEKIPTQKLLSLTLNKSEQYCYAWQWAPSKILSTIQPRKHLLVKLFILHNELISSAIRFLVACGVYFSNQQRHFVRAKCARSNIST